MFKKHLDEKWYIQRNPDVAASGMTAVEHYRVFGKAEGRLPCPPNALDKLTARSRIVFKVIALLAKQYNSYWAALGILAREWNSKGYAHLKHFVVRTFTQHQLARRGITYSQWLLHNEREDNAARTIAAADFVQQYSAPTISIVMATYNTPPEFLAAAIESVLKQAYPNWELCIADDHSTHPATLDCLKHYAAADTRIKVLYRASNGHISEATNSALTLISGEFVAFMDHDDCLHPSALLCVAQALADKPTVQFIYSDEDKINERGERSEPHFKSDFNYELLLSQNYICHLVVVNSALVKVLGGLRSTYNGAQDHDFILRVVEQVQPDDIFHIPKVLYHWRSHSASTAASTAAKPYAITAGRKAVADHLQRMGLPATVNAHPTVPFWHKVTFSLPSEPLIDIIIPTRDHITLMRQCVESILSKTTYKHYQITIVDNGSVAAETLAQFSQWTSAHRHIRVIHDDSPFNYAQLNNRAVQASTAELICLVNNDIEIISPHWLEEMAANALRDEIGCVGARLWYPDDTLQHGGVILGIGGVAGHAHKYWPKDDVGYMGRAQVAQALSAVTAACLMIRRATYLQVNGLDEQLKVAFNDVDFCLRVRSAGYRNMWTPFAEMYHHESASRGHEDNPEKVARFNTEIEFMKNRWGNELTSDPYYSPNLTLEHEDFSLASVARTAVY